MRLMPNLNSSSSLLLRAAIATVLIALLTACASTPGSSKSSSQTEDPRAAKAMIHTKLARGYMQQDQYATAKVELERALSIYPGHSDSNYVMALLMIKLEQYPDAEKFYKRAIRNNPRNSSAAHDFGVFLCQIGKQRDAIEYFDIAVSNPLFDKAELSYMRAGKCLSSIKDQQAEAYLKKALSINPQLRPALYRLALVKYGESNFLSARAYIERFLAITNPQPASLLLAYKIESSLNATDVAERYRRTLMKDFPGSQEAASLRPNRN